MQQSHPISVSRTQPCIVLYKSSLKATICWNSFRCNLVPQNITGTFSTCQTSSKSHKTWHVTYWVATCYSTSKCSFVSVCSLLVSVAVPKNFTPVFHKSCVLSRGCWVQLHCSLTWFWFWCQFWCWTSASWTSSNNRAKHQHSSVLLQLQLQSAGGLHVAFRILITITDLRQTL